MDIDVDLNDVIEDLLERNKVLTLENIILKKALDNLDKLQNEGPFSAPVPADTAE